MQSPNMGGGLDLLIMAEVKDDSSRVTEVVLIVVSFCKEIPESR